jgi:hypothetical protein
MASTTGLHLPQLDEARVNFLTSSRFMAPFFSILTISDFVTPLHMHTVIFFLAAICSGYCRLFTILRFIGIFRTIYYKQYC